MGEYVTAIALGAVQALTEFLPVSSSAHLVLAPIAFGAAPNARAFDVGLHVGTTVALLLVFWRDWASMLSAVVADAVSGLPFARWSAPGRQCILVALATLPVLIVRPILASSLESALRGPAPAAGMLIIFGLLLGIADRACATDRDMSEMRLRDVALVGVMQVMALAPGVSRSGVTITGARLLRFSRADSARFSFVIGMPAVAGAAVLSAVDVLAGREALSFGPAMAGLVTAALLGCLVIRWLLRFLLSGTLLPFVAYRVILGTAVLLWVAVVR